MTTVTTLALVRHGETAWNAERRLQGTTDIPLNDTGRDQVRQTAEVLRTSSWDFIVSSPLVRARESAEILSSRLGVAVKTEVPELIERHYGLAEGMQDGDELRSLRIPGGFEGAETEEAVATRAAKALHELVSEHPGARIIVVCHGTLIRIALSEFSGQKIDPITNAAHSVLLHEADTDTHTDEPLISPWTVSVVNGLPHRALTEAAVLRASR